MLWGRDSVIKESVFFERLRTLLHLSKHRKVEIWVVLRKRDQSISSARIISGVVRGIITGTAAEPFHKLHIGGRFTFDDIEDDGCKFHNMEEINAVSFHPMDMPTLLDFLQKGPWSQNPLLTRLMNLEPSTALGGRRYYEILFPALDNDAT